MKPTAELNPAGPCRSAGRSRCRSDSDGRCRPGRGDGGHSRGVAPARHFNLRTQRSGSGGAAGEVRPERSGAGKPARVAAPALGRRPQSAGHSADRAGDDLVCHRRYARRNGDAADGRVGRLAAVCAGDQGQHRRGQTQGDDQSHRHRRARRIEPGKSRFSSLSPATS